MTAMERLAARVTLDLIEYEPIRYEGGPCTCEQVLRCWFGLTPAERVEKRAETALVSGPGPILCGNCGCPQKDDEAHYPVDVGYCCMGVASTKGKGPRS